MRDIDSLTVLKGMIDECDACSTYLFENAALIADEGWLTDEQIEAIIVVLNDYHRKHAESD